MVSVEHCQVKISTDPMEGHWKFQGVGGGGGSQKPKVLKESVKLNLNFLWGWEELNQKNLPWGDGYFLEQHWLSLTELQVTSETETLLTCNAATVAFSNAVTARESCCLF